MGTPLYGTGAKNSAVHRTEDCPQTRGPQRLKYPIRQLDLDIIRKERLKLCKACFPDQPQVDTHHVACELCEQHYPHPCEHNGGVPVEFIDHHGNRKVRFVWPESAWRYTLVNPVHLN